LLVARKKDRFEQVGLALRVLALQQRQRRVESQVEVAIVAKMGERETHAGA
jgi:hypothetical protein